MNSNMVDALPLLAFLYALIVLLSSCCWSISLLVSPPRASST